MRRQTLSIARTRADVPAWSGNLALVFAAPDPRADNGQRKVSLLADAVRIERRIGGLPMRINVPYAAFRGIAIGLQDEPDATGERFSLVLLHSDSDLNITLFESIDETDVTAEWQFWAHQFSLPLLMIGADGVVMQPYGRLGALDVERPRPRRMPAHLASRRPRFLTRRRTGKLPEKPVVHEGRRLF